MISRKYTRSYFYEHSPAEFHRFPDQFIHRSSQKTDTGLEINLLQEYVFIPLDIFRGILHNGGIKNKLDAWLTFLSVDEPEMIVRLITEYPQFKAYYEEIYQLCRDTEKVMEMFSKELQELDRNTVQYMIDEMQEVIDAQKEDLSKQKEVIDAQKELLKQNESALADKEKEIAELKAQLAGKDGNK